MFVEREIYSIQGGRGRGRGRGKGLQCMTFIPGKTITDLPVYSMFNAALI